MSAATRARRRSGGAWAEWTIALTFVAVLVTSVAVVTPGSPPPQKRLECMSNASQLVQCYLLARLDKRFDPTLHGSAQILSWVPKQRRGDERVFFCPGDPETFPPETDDDARPFRPDGAEALRRAVGLGSYAVRDFEKYPIDTEAKMLQAILCDRQGADGRSNHHRHSIVVAFDNGEARTMTNEELGIPDGDPIVIGPDSPSPLLRVFERP